MSGHISNHSKIKTGNIDQDHVCSKGQPITSPALPVLHNFNNINIHANPFTFIQPKLSVNRQADKYEQEADAVADKIIRMNEAPVLQRKCDTCEEEEEKKIHRKPLSGGITPLIQTRRGTNEPAVSDSLNSRITSSLGRGSNMDNDTRSFMSNRFGVDFGNVKIHADHEAMEMNREINAKAFTIGNDIYFNDTEYRPQSLAGKHLLAHELTHVLQQSRDSRKVQRQDAGVPTTPTTSLRVGIIPIREFINHVATVERAYPSKSPQEILTMIRSMYYGSPAGSPAFDRLVPDAPNTGAVEVCTNSEGGHCDEPVGACTCAYAQGLAMSVDQLRAALSRLRQHANENEIADNPSPYIQVGNDFIDVGHLLLGVDAILHPRTDAPFSMHGLTSAPGPATWEGDVSAAMVYLAEHQATGAKSPDVKGNPSPTIASYYQNSAPMSDILGDVDAFGMASLVGPQTLSTALRYYYVSESAGSPRYQYNRWAGFCSTVGLTYIQNGQAITWTPAARQLVIDRISAFANLFHGRTRPIAAMTTGISPRSWPYVGNFADLFLHDVKQNLEQEIIHSTPSPP